MATTLLGEESESNYLGSARRYYLSKRKQAAQTCNKALEGVWRAKQEAQPGAPLAEDFPARSALVAVGYSTVEDLIGASLEELVNAGLALHDANAALAAME